MSPFVITLCISAILASTSANPYAKHEDHLAVPWPLFDPEDHQESLRINKRGGSSRKRYSGPPEIPTIIEGKA